GLRGGVTPAQPVAATAVPTRVVRAMKLRRLSRASSRPLAFETSQLPQATPWLCSVTLDPPLDESPPWYAAGWTTGGNSGRLHTRRAPRRGHRRVAGGGAQRRAR